MKRTPTLQDIQRLTRARVCARCPHRDHNPPWRERIREWQLQQDFPICPNLDDPDACNVYKDRKFPDGVYQHIEEYYEQKAESAST